MHKYVHKLLVGLLVCTTITNSYVCFILADSPTFSPTITSVQAMSRTSLEVDWMASDSIYNYQVCWTNSRTGVMESSSLLSPTTTMLNVSTLNGIDNYDVRVATVNVCGSQFSDPSTVFSELKYIRLS